MASEVVEGANAPVLRPIARVGDDALVTARREQIVRAAIKLVSKQGFAKTVIRDIAAEAGISVGLVYEYIRVKEDILFLVLEHGTDMWREGLQAAVKQDLGPFYRLFHGVSALVELADNNPDQVNLWYRETGNLTADGKAMLKQTEEGIVGLLAGLVTDAVKAGLLSEDLDSTATAVMLILNTHGWVLKRYLLRDRMSAADFAVWTMETFLLGQATDRGRGVWRELKPRSAP